MRHMRRGGIMTLALWRATWRITAVRWAVLLFAPLARPVAAQEPPLQDALAAAIPKKPCLMDQSKDKCQGHLIVPLAGLEHSIPDREALAKWLTDRTRIQFENGHLDDWPWRRDPQLLRIFHTKDTRSVDIRDLSKGNGALVVAKIVAELNKD